MKIRKRTGSWRTIESPPEGIKTAQKLILNCLRSKVEDNGISQHLADEKPHLTAIFRGEELNAEMRAFYEKIKDKIPRNLSDEQVIGLVGEIKAVCRLHAKVRHRTHTLSLGRGSNILRISPAQNLILESKSDP